MIVIDVLCEHGHDFEGWFRSAEEFVRQQAAGQVCCPRCGTSAVRRRPSAAHLGSSRPAPEARGRVEDPAVLARMLAAHLRSMARQAVDVGERFPEEARRIHYGDADPRTVRGRASRDELEALIDEGIGVLPVPPEDDLH